MFEQVKAAWIMLFANGPRRQTSHCFKAVPALHNEKEVSYHHYGCCERGWAHHFVCKWGGCPRNPHAVSKPSMLPVQKEASCHHHVCSKGGVCGDHCRCKLGELRSPPRFFRSRPKIIKKKINQKKKKKHTSCLHHVCGRGKVCVCVVCFPDISK